MYVIVHGEKNHRRKIDHKFKTKANAKKYIKTVLQRPETRGAFDNPRVKKVEK